MSAYYPKNGYFIECEDNYHKLGKQVLSDNLYLFLQTTTVFTKIFTNLIKVSLIESSFFCGVAFEGMSGVDAVVLLQNPEK